MSITSTVPVEHLLIHTVYNNKFFRFSDEMLEWLYDNNITDWTLSREGGLSHINAIREFWNVPQGHIVTFKNPNDCLLFTLTWL